MFDVKNPNEVYYLLMNVRSSYVKWKFKFTCETTLWRCGLSKSICWILPKMCAFKVDNRISSFCMLFLFFESSLERKVTFDLSTSKCLDSSCNFVYKLFMCIRNSAYVFNLLCKNMPTSNKQIFLSWVCVNYFSNGGLTSSNLWTTINVPEIW